MSAINKVILIGNTGNIEIKDNVTRVSLATTEKFRDKNGEQVTQTQWHRLVFSGKLAEIANKYVQKGSKLYVEGPLKYSKFAKQDGSEGFSADIIVKNMQLLTPKGEATSAPAKPSNQNPSGWSDFEDDDIPF